MDSTRSLTDSLSIKSFISDARLDISSFCESIPKDSPLLNSFSLFSLTAISSRRRMYSSLLSIDFLTNPLSDGLAIPILYSFNDFNLSISSNALLISSSMDDIFSIESSIILLSPCPFLLFSSNLLDFSRLKFSINSFFLFSMSSTSSGLLQVGQMKSSSEKVISESLMRFHSSISW